MKKSARALGTGLLAVSLVLAVAPAMAGDDCDVPIERWQKRDAVRRMADGNGWTLKRIKIDDGCYEVRGEDAQGRGFKAKLDPETLEIVKIKYRRDDTRDRRRARDRDDSGVRSPVPPAAPAAPAAATNQPSASISVSGAQIE